MRLLTIAVALAISTLAIGSSAQAEKKKSGSYAECKTKLSKVPPCNSTWTRWCVAQCGGK